MAGRIAKTIAQSVAVCLTSKKDGTNVFCSCREASDANYFRVRHDQEDHSPSPEYLHHTIDSVLSKYKNRNFLAMRDIRPFDHLEHVTGSLVASRES